ncbi:MAG: lysozyme inhibitor LprI family protein [Burkholderiaceae bacterium]|nr:lysozyme inhibitor LprI family protein [Burkholderiaceae bacterium]
MKARQAAFAFCLTVAAAAAGAQTSALDECRRQASDTAQLAQCLQLAQRTANDDMLATFQQIERRLRQREPAEAGDAAAAALRRSQRDFERYVEGQCGFVHALAGGGGLGDVAALACEIDLLRQRQFMLQTLLPRASN